MNTHILLIHGLGANAFTMSGIFYYLKYIGFDSVILTCVNNLKINLKKQKILI